MPYFGVVCLKCGPQEIGEAAFLEAKSSALEEGFKCPACQALAPFDDEEFEASKKEKPTETKSPAPATVPSGGSKRDEFRANMERRRQFALSKCAALVIQKGKDYGHWTEYHPADVAGVNGVKAKRIRELTIQMVSNPAEFAEANEPLEDSIVDAINYLSFLYGLVLEWKDQCKRESSGSPS